MNFTRLTMFPHGIMFHHFHASGSRCAQGSLTAETLSDIIQFLSRRHSILGADEWLERAQTKRLEPYHICLTFDDNLRCQYDIAVPVLKAYGLTGFFFIYSSVNEGFIENLEVYRVFRTHHHDRLETFYRAFEAAVEAHLPDIRLPSLLAGFRPETYLQPFAFYTPEDRRFRYIRDEVLGPDYYSRIMDAMIAARGLTKEHLAEQLWMDDAMLRRLSEQGHVVGLHSYSHATRIAALPAAEQRSQYERNHAHIARATGRAPLSMSHPCNSYNQATLAILAELGITLGFCSNMARGGAPGMLEYPRRDHADIVAEMAYENRPIHQQSATAY